MKMHRIVAAENFGVAVLLTVLMGCLADNDRESTAPMSQEAKAATARLKTISESREAGDLAEIGRLIEAGANVNVINRLDVTPLMIASGYGHTEVVKLLLEAGADVNAKASIAGKDYTPLSVAKLGGHIRIVVLLKKHGAKE